jgi:hypothetical protein
VTAVVVAVRVVVTAVTRAAVVAVVVIVVVGFIVVAAAGTSVVFVIHSTTAAVVAHDLVVGGRRRPAVVVVINRVRRVTIFFRGRRVVAPGRRVVDRRAGTAVGRVGGVVLDGVGSGRDPWRRLGVTMTEARRGRDATKLRAGWRCSLLR